MAATASVRIEMAQGPRYRIRRSSSRESVIFSRAMSASAGAGRFGDESASAATTCLPKSPFRACAGFQLMLLGLRLLVDGSGSALLLCDLLDVASGSCGYCSGGKSGSAGDSSPSSVDPDERLFMGGEGPQESVSRTLREWGRNEFGVQIAEDNGGERSRFDRKAGPFEKYCSSRISARFDAYVGNHENCGLEPKDQGSTSQSKWKLWSQRQ
jgi:hypothetical protein